MFPNFQRQGKRISGVFTYPNFLFSSPCMGLWPCGPLSLRVLIPFTYANQNKNQKDIFIIYCLSSISNLGDTAELVQHRFLYPLNL